MTAVLLGGVAALLYVLGWMRGYQSYKESPDQLRQRRDDADRVATAALKRAVDAERQLESARKDAARLLNDWHRLRGWLQKIEVVDNVPTPYVQGMASRALSGDQP